MVLCVLCVFDVLPSHCRVPEGGFLLVCSASSAGFFHMRLVPLLRSGGMSAGRAAFFLLSLFLRSRSSCWEPGSLSSRLSQCSISRCWMVSYHPALAVSSSLNFFVLHPCELLAPLIVVAVSNCRFVWFSKVCFICNYSACSSVCFFRLLYHLYDTSCVALFQVLEPSALPLVPSVDSQ